MRVILNILYYWFNFVIYKKFLEDNEDSFIPK